MERGNRIEGILTHFERQYQNGEGQSVKEEGKTETRTDSLVFPRDCSRSVMAAKLSIVGRACGIRERLSYHMARHREFYKHQIINRLYCLSI